MLDAKVLQQKMVPNDIAMPMEDDVYVVMMDAKIMHNQKGVVSHTVQKRRDALSTVARSNHRIRMAGARGTVGQSILCSSEGCSYKMHSRKMCRMHIRTTMAADTMLMMSDAGGIKLASFPTAMETAEETTVSNAGGNKSIEGPTTTMIEGSTFILSNYLLFFCISALCPSPRR